MTTPRVRCKNISKRFRLGDHHESLGDLIAAGIRKLIRPRPCGRRQAGDDGALLWAVRNLEFSVQPGEALGVIGPNGAGKSTLLRLLAGILRPDEGDLEVQGRVTALIEVGAGFHGDLTGRENIYLNGAILGMSRAEVRRKLDAIVDFAGIGRFLDEPVKRYSSGMYARLGFGIAAHVDPDVLLVDEVLSVGDAVFRLRCMEHMRRLLREGVALVFVSHQLDQVQSICERALVLEAGRCAFDGPSREAVAQYLTAMSYGFAARPTDLTATDQRDPVVADCQLRFLDERGDEVVWIRADRPLWAELQLRLRRPVQNLIVELNLRASPQENLLSFNSGRSGKTLDFGVGEHTIILNVPRVPLAGGQYFWNVRAWDADQSVTLLDTPLRFPMVVDDGGKATGKLVLEHSWHVDPTQSADGAQSETPGTTGVRYAVEESSLAIAAP